LQLLRYLDFAHGHIAILIIFWLIAQPSITYVCDWAPSQFRGHIWWGVNAQNMDTRGNEDPRGNPPGTRRAVRWRGSGPDPAAPPSGRWAAAAAPWCTCRPSPPRRPWTPASRPVPCRRADFASPGHPAGENDTFWVHQRLKRWFCEYYLEAVDGIKRSLTNSRDSLPNMTLRFLQSRSVLAALHTVRERQCSRSVLAALHTVRERQRSRSVLAALHPVRERQCSRSVLAALHTVRERQCSRSVLAALHTVRERQCSRSVLAALHTVRERQRSAYLKQPHKLLDSALGHHHGLSATQKSQAAGLGNQDLRAGVPEQPVQKESAGPSEDAVHVHRVALHLLQLWVTQAPYVLLQPDRNTRELSRKLRTQPTTCLYASLFIPIAGAPSVPTTPPLILEEAYSFIWVLPDRVPIPSGTFQRLSKPNFLTINDPTQHRLRHRSSLITVTLRIVYIMTIIIYINDYNT